eukprot:239487_1
MGNELTTEKTYKVNKRPKHDSSDDEDTTKDVDYTMKNLTITMTTYKINKRPKDDSSDDEQYVDDTTKDVDYTMKNAVVLIICVGEYEKEKDLQGAKTDLGRYRSLFEHQYGYDVYPKSGDKNDFKFYWKRGEILRFINKYKTKVFDDETEEKQQQQKQKKDGLIIIFRGHGDDGE